MGSLLDSHFVGGAGYADNVESGGGSGDGLGGAAVDGHTCCVVHFDKGIVGCSGDGDIATDRAHCYAAVVCGDVVYAGKDDKVFPDVSSLVLFDRAYGDIELALCYLDAVERVWSACRRLGGFDVEFIQFCVTECGGFYLSHRPGYGNLGQI